MAPPSELFGKRPNGDPRVPDLSNEAGQPARDIILPVCYRNTPWALTVAHALGFGVYRERGFVQFFDELSLLTEVGYEVRAGELAHGAEVSIKRSNRSAPEYFGRLLNERDAVETYVFDSKEAQADAIAEMIQRNITEDELELRDILVVVPDALTAPKEAGVLIKALSQRSIPAHLAGVTASRDRLFDDASVAISGIYRAKGNEAPMVYIMNADYCFDGPELSKRRNIIFTAITRSRAWVRVCGIGERMQKLTAEVEEVFNHDFRLDFRVPTPPEMDRMRRIHRDATPEEKERARKAEASLSKIVDQFDRGELSLELSGELRERLLAMLQEEEDDV